MKRSKLTLSVTALLILTIQSFTTGTLIYYAVDVFALYSENQFTGRMRSFDIDYWNAVLGSALIYVPLLFSKSVTAAAKKMIHESSEEDEMFAEWEKRNAELSEEFIKNFKAKQDTQRFDIANKDIWEAPKKNN